MALRRRIAVDLANVYSSATGRKVMTTLAWGDEIDVEQVTAKHVKIKIRFFRELDDGTMEPVSKTGFIRPTKSSKIKPSEVVVKKSEIDVLKVDFVDIQQGDASVIETPKGKVILLDGGDNQLFARYLAGRYGGTSDAKPLAITAIVVSHGDADHFKGLTEIHESETHATAHKRIFIRPERVYHNGLVKRPGKKPNGKTRKENEMLGATKAVAGKVVVTELESNLTTVSDAKMNKPFRDWKKALKGWKKRGPIKFRRLERGDDDAFDFLANEDIEVDVLGPALTNAGNKKGLVFLGRPKEKFRAGHESLFLDESAFTGTSASHTINGHSIVLRIKYGRFRFLFSGDLNDQAGRELTRAHNAGEVDLESEVFKVPHHGSADFSAALLEAVSPIISVVSSGDENPAKEYIHPRATLVGALGKFSRVEEPLLFVTELVAFFRVEGFVRPEFHRLDNDGDAVVKNGEAVVNDKTRTSFFAFSRTAFGIVKVRTDGERLLVYTNSGQQRLKEAYVYGIDEDTGKLRPERVRRV